MNEYTVVYCKAKGEKTERDTLMDMVMLYNKFYIKSRKNK
jgi:hypothetical protein